MIDADTDRFASLPNIMDIDRAYRTIPSKYKTNLSYKNVHVSIAWGRSCFVACTCKLYMLARISMQRTGEQDRCVESVAGIPFKMDAQAGY